MKLKKKWLIVQAAGLGWNLFENSGRRSIGGMNFRPAETVFPAVTCTVQASFRTASSPAEHGFPANGFFDRELKKAFFWEQSASLVGGRRIWDKARERGASVAILFWQQSLGENADMILSPAPIHKHGGGMLPACYSRPEGLCERIRRRLHSRFRLMDYWGPLSSRKSTDWIAGAVNHLLATDEAPDICLCYLPLLDYDQQRFGPDHPRVRKMLDLLLKRLADLYDLAARNDREIIVFGDYAIVAAERGPVYPNLALRESGWFQPRNVAGMSYPDLFGSRAFALCDHEIAHVYVDNGEDIDSVKKVLAYLPGVEKVLDSRHPATNDPMWAGKRAGDLLAIAAPGHWFSYKWWDHGDRAPDFARHVDIHSKPGFDPCELFFGWPPGSISRDDRKVGGTHGRTGTGREIALAVSNPELMADSLLDVAKKVESRLDGS